MAQKTPVAALQMCSGHQVGDNLAVADALLAEAARQGAQLAVLPENFSCMPRYEAERVEVAEADGQGPVQDWCAQASQRHGLWLIAGTIPLLPDHPQAQDAQRVRAASLVFDARGQRVARYDKIHLFDVTVSEQDVSGEVEQYRESDSIEAGSYPACVDTVAGCVGLSVCYDLRFPELYRLLADAGAELLSVPAAFTEQTGRAHWQLLLQARAVENLAWVLGAAQQGRHSNGRSTWGHAMIIDPWGRVLAQRRESGPGVVMADIDLQRQQALRGRFDALGHRRL